MALQPAVFDASTLILLAKADLLRRVAGSAAIHIPRVVEREALAKPGAYDAQLIARMIKEGAVCVSDAARSAEVKSIEKQFRLAEGEAAALWLAKEKRCALGIDDGPGIRAAKVLGIPFMTAVQILVGISRGGGLDQAAAIAKLDCLAAWGRYSPQLLGDARLKIQRGGD